MDTKLHAMLEDLERLGFPDMSDGSFSPLADSLVEAASRMAHQVVTCRVLAEFTAGQDDLARCRDIVVFMDEYVGLCARLRSTARDFMLQYQDVAICSLGWGCLMRTLLTKFGLILTREEGRRTCPFDLSAHSLDAVTQLLENGFARYAEPGRLRHEFRLRLPWRPGALRMIRHKDYDAAFIHDAPFYPRRGDLKKLSAVLGQRVLNMGQLLSAGRRALLVLDSPDPVSLGGAERLRAAVLRRFGADSMLLALFPGAQASFERAGSVCLAQYVLPSEGYVWPKATHYMTAGGVAFESAVVGHVLRCLREMGPCGGASGAWQRS